VLSRTILALLMAVALAPAASAHSLKELDAQLFGEEKYFQPMDVAAPAFSLRDQDGRTVSSADLRGKVVVLNFIYTHCPDACPLQTEKLAGVQRLVNVTPMKDRVRFVTITTDPKRDDGETLREYAKVHGVDPTNWVFLTTAPDQPEDTTRKLARAYGLEFTPEDNGLEIHGVVTHVIDQSGRMLARFHGLDFDPTNLVMFVNALTNHLQDHRHDDAPGLWSKLRGLF
jgi:protein SCO1